MPTIEFQPSMKTPRSLRVLRANTSLGDVARGTGMKPSHLSRIFNGRRMPRMDTAQRICAYLDCTVDDLIAAVSEQSAVPDERFGRAA